MKSDADKYIFTEDLDYSKTSIASIWGLGDSRTLQELSRLATSGAIKGNWLHFAAGDGRYNEILLNAADTVTATDIDDSALEKLKRVTNPKLIHKLQTQNQDISKPFPFKKNTFDVVFNAGTLHLFPEEILEQIIMEVARVLKQDGIFIFDFATDISRINSNGTFIGTPNRYTSAQAKTLLERMLSNHQFASQFLFDTVQPELVTGSEGIYTFSCNFWLIIARKK